jgi:hypothetical protein
VGNDGGIGVALFMDGLTTTNRAIFQSAGNGCRLTRKCIEEIYPQRAATPPILS